MVIIWLLAQRALAARVERKQTATLTLRATVEWTLKPAIRTQRGYDAHDKIITPGSVDPSEENDRAQMIDPLNERTVQCRLSTSGPET